MHTLGVLLIWVVVCLSFVLSSVRSTRRNINDGEAVLHLFDNDEYPTARCLDGSPAGFYTRHATSDSAQNKWVFALQGGGECVSEIECRDRSLTPLGSSTNWTDTIALRHIQDVHEKYSPYMYDWNMVYIPYCSGDLHVGQVSQPSSKTWGFVFNGHNIIASVFKHLQHHMQLAEMVVWSGESAGGIGCVAHVDWVADQLPKSTRVLGATIGGFYWFAGQTYDGPGHIPYTEWNAVAWASYYALFDAFLPQRCVSVYRKTPWMCALANVSFATIETPMFFVQSQTDRAVMKLHDGVPSSTPPLSPPIEQYAQLWSVNMSQALAQVHASPTSGLFNAACWIHTSFRFKHPTIGNPPLGWMDTFNNWAFNLTGPTKLWDDCGHTILCNPTCPSSLRRHPGRDADLPGVDVRDRDSGNSDQRSSDIDFGSDPTGVHDIPSGSGRLRPGRPSQPDMDA